MTYPRNNVESRYQILCWLLAFAFLLLAGCQSRPQPVPPSAPVSVPALPDAPRYTIDPSASELRVLVWRAGALQDLGHNHVIVAPVHGVIHAGESAEKSGFRVTIDVTGFDVDPAVARREEGARFAGEITNKARADTRANLLGEDVLDAASHPRIEVQSIAMHGPRWNPQVRARVMLRGVAREVHFPAAVSMSGDALVVIANFTVLQSDFGITPFSVLGGGLAVRDALDVRIRLFARRAASVND